MLDRGADRRHLPSARPVAAALSRRILPLLGAMAVIVAALVMADHARVVADRARQAQIVIQHLRAESLDLDSISWRELASTARDKRPARAAAAGIATYRSMGSDVRTLRRLGVPRSRLKPIGAQLGLISTYGYEASSTSYASPQRARELVHASFSPAVDRFTTLTDAAAGQQGRTAASAERRMEIGWLGSLIGSVLLLGLLGWRLHRSERAVAIAGRAREAERRAEERLRALVRHSSDVVAVIDESALVHWIGESVQMMLGHPAHVLAGRTFTDLLHTDDVHRAEAMLDDARHGDGRTGTVGLRLRHADGGYRDVEVIADNRLQDPDIAGILLNLRDVSERLALLEQLQHQAFHDSLTGLPNRALFDDRLHQALARLPRRDGSATVIFIDLDEFKSVNDVHGHSGGDELLRVAATRIAGALRVQDTAARLGGDEFAVLIEDNDDPAGVPGVADRIHEALRTGLMIDGHRVTPSASMGFATASRSASAEEILGDADVALYEAKRRGRGLVVPYEPVMREVLTERLSLTEDLATALEDEQFLLEYQPVVKLESGVITGVEALVRWQHPARGLITPDRFIGLTEFTGQIVALGGWVLDRACAQLSSWDAARSDTCALEMNVNVSTNQLREPGFPETVRATLARHGVAAERVTLEITESALLDDSDTMLQQLHKLKDLGVRLAVDDFGTGYSALSYLQSFPIDVLKIDRSFVSGIDRDPEKAGLVQGIIEIGHTLNLRVVTEGIEHPKEAALLRELHSGFGQGFLFSRPVGPDALLALLDAQATRANQVAA
jgi:diguanylate cyclase (GGDEF)-like protein/PAS domain S-box-containing protein